MPKAFPGNLLWLCGIVFLFLGSGAYADMTAEAVSIAPQSAAPVSAEAVPQAIIKETKLTPLLLNVTLNKIYARPDKSSKVVFEIPFDFRIVATSPGERWVKIRAEYELLGKHVVEGWGQVRE